MSLFYGACLGPERMERAIRAHLFVVSPNNSGSTFLSRALATCRQAWSLPDESRRVHGFAGPAPTADGPLRGAVKIWAAEPRWLDVLADAGAYDWARIRKAWYFQARAGDPRASVLVAKAPQDLCIVDDVARNFRNPRFVFTVRNPYAVCEGICRYLRRRVRRGWPVDVRGEPLEAVAARHVAACFALQRRNVEAQRGRGIFFTYETMCAEPERVARDVRALAPELDDLNLRQRLWVKRGRYHEMLTDMNARQIARLDDAQLAAFNRVFRRHEALLDWFGYRIVDAAARGRAGRGRRVPHKPPPGPARSAGSGA